MALETASYIANLVTSNPDGGDQRSTADDHLRLIKAVLVRTFPKIDAAVSISAAQVMYINDLSASVQLQLNTLRDGPATANFAVVAGLAQSASVANFIGTIPAARVPDLNAINTWTVIEPVRIRHGSGFISFYKTDGSARIGYLQMADGSAGVLALEQSIPFQVYTSNQLRFQIAPDGAATFFGNITGTISNATLAATATNAINATNAANASTAAFATSAGSSALLGGLAPADVGTANTIAQRNSSGDLFARYLNQSSGPEGVSVGHIACMGNVDGYWRVASVATVGQYLAGQNVSGRTGINKTLSSSSPSGGANGDIWYQY